MNFTRIFASDTHGVINVWDRRVKALPCLELTSSSSGTLNSIQLNAENEVEYFVYILLCYPLDSPEKMNCVPVFPWKGQNGVALIFPLFCAGNSNRVSLSVMTEYTFLLKWFVESSFLKRFEGILSLVGPRGSVTTNSKSHMSRSIYSTWFLVSQVFNILCLLTCIWEIALAML